MINSVPDLWPWMVAPLGKRLLCGLARGAPKLDLPEPQIQIPRLLMLKVAACLLAQSWQQGCISGANIGILRLCRWVNGAQSCSLQVEISATVQFDLPAHYLNSLILFLESWLKRTREREREFSLGFRWAAFDWIFSNPISLHRPDTIPLLTHTSLTYLFADLKLDCKFDIVANMGNKPI